MAGKLDGQSTRKAFELLYCRCFLQRPRQHKRFARTRTTTPYFTKLLKHNPDWKWSAVEIIETEKGFTLKWKAEIPVKEKTITLLGLDIVELTNGKISRNEVYFDRTDWLSAANKS